MGVYLTGMHLMGVYLINVHLTGMHILVVEALLIAIYSTWERANTYTHRKILSVECLSRANSRSLSSCAFPAGSCPAVPFQLVPVQLRYTNVRAYEPAKSNETRPARNRGNG